jgi:hypothetical protein
MLQFSYKMFLVFNALSVAWMGNWIITWWVVMA